MRNIELPRKILIGEDAVYKINDIITDLDLKGRPLIICDETTKEVVGDIISEILRYPVFVIKNFCAEEIKYIREKIQEDNIRYIVGVGGGHILDTGKVIAYKNKIPFISVPTAASHDGIASPLVALKKNQPVSVSVHCPLAIIADTKIISKAPKRLLASGCGDVLSNYTAVLDWRLAHKEKNEYYGDYASSLSEMSAKIVMMNADRIHHNINILIEALISSGVAIAIAGSSRPCSGAEHMFSHTLDMICEKPALHGEQCGLGAILTAYLHKADWECIRDSLKKCGAPITAKEIGIPRNKIIEAILSAHKIRKRYTILREGISEKSALEAAKKTGVI